MELTNSKDVSLGSYVYDPSTGLTGSLIGKYRTKFGTVSLVEFESLENKDKSHEKFLKKVANIDSKIDLSKCKIFFGQLITDNSILGNRRPDIPGEFVRQNPEDADIFREQDVGPAGIIPIKPYKGRPQMQPRGKKDDWFEGDLENPTKDDVAVPGIDKHIFNANYFKLKV